MSSLDTQPHSAARQGPDVAKLVEITANGAEVGAKALGAEELQTGSTLVLAQPGSAPDLLHVTPTSKASSQQTSSGAHEPCSKVLRDSDRVEVKRQSPLTPRVPALPLEWLQDQAAKAILDDTESLRSRRSARSASSSTAGKDLQLIKLQEEILRAKREEEEEERRAKKKLEIA